MATRGAEGAGTRRLPLTLLLVALGAVPATAGPPLTALAPVETLVSGQRELVGVAVAADGTAYVSDVRAGTVLRVTPSGTETVVARGLDGPLGLALDAQGRLLVAEGRAERVVRIESDGALTVLASGLRKPRWLAVAPDGALYIAAHRLLGPDGSDPDEAQVIVRRHAVTGALAVVATDVRHLEALALNGEFLYAAARRVDGLANADGAIVRYPLHADGALGVPTYVVASGFAGRPIGLALDRLGALYVGARELRIAGTRVKRAVGKVHLDARITELARELEDPRGIALGPDGSLWVADGDDGRLLRFRAPPPPALTAPPFTNRSPLALTGATEPDARVDVFVDDAVSPATVTASAAGAFTASLALTPNASATMVVFATPHGGDGLTSAAATATVTHDDRAPALAFQAPAALAHLRQSVAVRVQAADEGSGVASLALTADSQPLTAALAPALPAATVTATATLNTAALADGTHTLGASAQDTAGSRASASRVIVVDNTPPDTAITAGPGGDVAEPGATFSVTGTDNLTPAGSLLFAWRLDGDAFTSFSSATAASVTNVAEGPHTFEVKARDLAGNEDPTPARRTFTVRLGPSIATLDPATGPIGAFVTIGGAGFQPGATTVAFDGVAATVRTVSPTAITTTVPIGATTGPLVVTTPAGSATAAFAVTPTGDFTLTASPAPPAAVRVIAGDRGFARITAAGGGIFTGLVAVDVSTAPTGVTAVVSPRLVAPGGGTFLALAVGASVPPGSYAFTVSGQAEVDGRRVTRTTPVVLDVLPAATVAVTGRVLTAEAIPQPIPGATVALGTAFALTDAAGNFVLLGAPAGPAMLVVDGRTASTADAQFPLVEVQVDVSPSGPSRVPFVLYLPKIDTANPVDLPTDTTGAVTRTVQATTPRIPGLVVTIPQGTRIIGPDGNPVRQLTITPVPIDRSPMPFPPGVAPPMLFAIQPGGAAPSQPLPITFPNPRLANPGTSADLYYFDLVAGTWDVWGRGTVGTDGGQIASDPGFGLPRLAWHFPCAEDCFGPPDDAPPGDNQPRPTDGDPVDLFTGRLTMQATDLRLPARIPIRIERGYWSGLDGQGFFGRGWNFMVYDARLTTSGSSLLLVQADRSRLLFTPDGPGRWVNRSAPAMSGSVVTQRAGDFLFDLRARDGTIHRFDRVVGFSNVAALAAIVDRNGNTVTITREGSNAQSFGRITRITEPAGRAFVLGYDDANRIVTVTDPIDRVVRYAYDAQGRLATVTDAAGGVTGYTYDVAGRLLTLTDPRSHVVLTNEYDTAGRVARQLRADGSAWRYDYAAIGAAALEMAVTDPRGHSTTHRFDPRGFEISTTDALGQTTVNEYAPGSNQLRVTTDPLGRAIRYDYDASGNVVKVTDRAGQSVSYAYEPAFGQMTSRTDELGSTTRFEYDAAGNLVAVIDALGHRTTLTRDGHGQLTASADPLASVTTFASDAFGHRVAVTNPLGDTVRREYDAAGRLVARIDPLGARTAFFHDALDRMTRIVDPAGGVTRFVYDPNGNLLSVEDARANTTSHVHDALNRLVARTDAAGRTETFSYDGRDNLTAHADRNGRVRAYRHDGLNRVVRVAYADGATLQLGYDAVGDLVEAVDSQAGSIERQHDVRGRLIGETTGRGTMAYRYDGLGRPVEMTAPGQAAVTYSWDRASRLVGITQGSSSVRFDYDAAGRRTRVTSPNLVATEYDYDAASRITGLTYRAPAGILGALRYGYDAVGRRISESGSFARTLLPEAVTQAAYGAGNRQTRFGDALMTYDDNGNVTSLTDPGGTTTFAWDIRDRLAGVDGPGRRHAFSYDAFGRRVRSDADGAVVEYLYDRTDIAQESRDGRVIGYLRALWPDEPFARGTDEFYALTAGGSVLALVDERAALKTAYAYAPFGAASADGSPTTNPFTYAGREDDGADLYFYRARYYSPRLGRFLSEDPSGFAAGDPNLYGYVYNNPISFIDPSGRDATIWWPAGPGRSLADGPRNGNWGGSNWSGGHGPPFNGPMLPPTDSGDECYMGHDLCWGECEKCPGKKVPCMKQCDRVLVRCLRNLSTGPSQWPRPPRPGTDRESRIFSRWAIPYFEHHLWEFSPLR
jgi:RHS repeat-associated protein